MLFLILLVGVAFGAPDVLQNALQSPKAFVVSDPTKIVNFFMVSKLMLTKINVQFYNFYKHRYLKWPYPQKLMADYDAEFGKKYEGAEAKMRMGLFRKVRFTNS